MVWGCNLVYTSVVTVCVYIYRFGFVADQVGFVCYTRSFLSHVVYIRLKCAAALHATLQVTTVLDYVDLGPEIVGLAQEGPFNGLLALALLQVMLMALIKTHRFKMKDSSLSRMAKGIANARRLAAVRFGRSGADQMDTEMLAVSPDSSLAAECSMPRLPTTAHMPPSGGTREHCPSSSGTAPACSLSRQAKPVEAVNSSTGLDTGGVPLSSSAFSAIRNGGNGSNSSLFTLGGAARRFSASGPPASAAVLEDPCQEGSTDALAANSALVHPEDSKILKFVKYAEVIFALDLVSCF